MGLAHALGLDHLADGLPLGITGAQVEERPGELEPEQPAQAGEAPGSGGGDTHVSPPPPLQPAPIYISEPITTTEIVNVYEAPEPAQPAAPPPAPEAPPEVIGSHPQPPSGGWPPPPPFEVIGSHPQPPSGGSGKHHVGPYEGKAHGRS